MCPVPKEVQPSVTGAATATVQTVSPPPTTANTPTADLNPTNTILAPLFDNSSRSPATAESSSSNENIIRW